MSAEFNQFVKKLVLHNKLATEVQMEDAEAMVDDETHLLEALKLAGALNDAKANAVAKAWTTKTGKPVPSAGGGDDAEEEDAPPARPAVAARPPTSGGAPAGLKAAPPAVAKAPPAATGASIGKDVSGFTHLTEYFSYARTLTASDLHIIVDSPPVVRLNGRLMNLNRAPLAADETKELLWRVLSKDQQKAVEQDKNLDFSYADDKGRCRSCIVRHRLGYDGAFRLIPPDAPTFEQLGLPESLVRLTEFHQGLVLITGPSGCGKSSTLAAMVDLVNKNRADHIIVIEDPIEYVFKAKKAHISQRGVGPHTDSFAAALRGALRENPDVIVLGELRDLETVSLAITASETGHLVFGTLPTTTAPRTIDRLLDVFPPEEQSQIRSMISESIKGIVCQQLVPRKDGKGRVLAMEILFTTPAVSNLIRERKLHQMESAMQTGKKLGMVLLDNSLEELVASKQIDGSEAWYAANNKKKFEQYAPKSY